MPAPKKTESLDVAMKKLEALVERLENDQLPLEDALKQFEEGVALTKRCQKKLSEAERKIQLLTEKNELIDFDDE